MRYVRNPAVKETVVDDELFLAQSATGAMYYLDTISMGVWRLLDEARSREELVDVYMAAFPNVDREQIEQDLTHFLEDMLAQGVVIEAP